MQTESRVNLTVGWARAGARDRTHTRATRGCQPATPPGPAASPTSGVDVSLRRKAARAFPGADGPSTPQPPTTAPHSRCTRGQARAERAPGPAALLPGRFWGQEGAHTQSRAQLAGLCFASSLHLVASVRKVLAALVPRDSGFRGPGGSEAARCFITWAAMLQRPV